MSKLMPLLNGTPKAACKLALACASLLLAMMFVFSQGACVMRVYDERNRMS